MTHHVPTYANDQLEDVGAERSDAELITAVRGGDDDAYAALWSRHELAAKRLARQIGNPSNADDLVSEAFLRVLRALKSGSGPDGAFRPYLFSTLRRINIDNGRSYYTRVSLTDDDRDLEGDAGDSAADVMFENAEGSAAWRAWNSLPDATRTLLWHLVIEEETPAQIAPLIGTSANGVSSRAVRAKERLRQAFLQQHLLDADSDGCRRARSRLGEYVRNALSARDRAEVQAHLDSCAGCSAAVFEVSDLNQTLRVLIAPLVLGGTVVAGHYLAAGAAAKGSIFGSVRLHHLRNPAVAATVVAAVVAAGVGTAWGLGAFSSSPKHHTTPAAAAVHSAPTAGSGGAPAVGPAPTATATGATSSPGSVPVSPSPTVRVTPTTPSAARPTAPTSAAPSSKVTVTAPTSPLVVPPPPPPPEQTSVDLFVIPTQVGVLLGKMTLTTDGGWTISKVTLTINGVDASNLCTSSGSSGVCNLPLPLPNTEQHYVVTAVSPSSANPPGNLVDTYYADNNEVQTESNPLGTN